ncbi:MAG: type II toxin-antitoxin system mRNA interferase toxin, RelE/StbE family [Verrucomicrobiae bacterium]|nr:type II toxin-antitoxin system mRNA interferase toxin, RelE/StbE family [Verrucomicrobiae bacterium]
MIVPSRTFQKQFEKLDSQIQKRVIAKVEELDAGLSHWQHERLQGRAEYKLRVGDWRVLYVFDLSKTELHLLTVRHRREVYR